MLDGTRTTTKDLLQATRDATRNTYAGAFGQIPGLSIPCGFSTAGLPVGLQLEAAWWEEPLLLRSDTVFKKSPTGTYERPAEQAVLRAAVMLICTQYSSAFRSDSHRIQRLD